MSFFIKSREVDEKDHPSNVIKELKDEIPTVLNQIIFAYAVDLQEQAIKLSQIMLQNNTQLFHLSSKFFSNADTGSGFVGRFSFATSVMGTFGRGEEDGLKTVLRNINAINMLKKKEPYQLAPANIDQWSSDDDQLQYIKELFFSPKKWANQPLKPRGSETFKLEEILSLLFKNQDKDSKSPHTQLLTELAEMEFILNRVIRENSSIHMNIHGLK